MSPAIPLVRVTVLVENTVYRAGLLAEHGLSLLIETQDDVVLFDTGQTDLVVRNARALNVDLSRVTSCVLSHGHYDHAGGLAAVFELLPRTVVVHAHTSIWSPRWSVKPGKPPKYVGVDPALQAHRARFSLHASPAYVCDGVTFLGSVRRCYHEGDGLSNFYLDQDGIEADCLPDDSGVLVDTAAGVLLITGCGHAGVRNYLDHGRSVLPGRKWAMVMGGLHLRGASETDLADARDALLDAKVPHVGAMHCTGPRGLVALSGVPGLQAHAMPVGTVVEVSKDGGVVVR